MGLKSNRATGSMVQRRTLWKSRCVPRLVMCAFAGYALASCMYAALAQAAPPPQEGHTNEQLYRPMGVAYDSAGNLFFADAGRNQVLEVTLAGKLQVIAGTGVQGYGGDDGPASEALLDRPEGVAVAKDSAVYVADTGNHRVRMIKDGVIRTVAGTGARGAGGDGGPALQATFDQPSALALDSDSALLVCDSGNHSVRRIASSGIVSAFAGTGAQGFSGDGGPARLALFDSPSGIAVLADGSVIIADARNHRLRRIGPDNIISTVAGTGVQGFSGDRGPATAARLSFPRSVTVTPSGTILFSDSDNHRIRAISSDGFISTVAGDGWQGSSSDNQAAISSSMDSPRGIAASVYGLAAYADRSNRDVRQIANDFSAYVVAVAPATRQSAVTMKLPPSIIYGQGTATAGVTTTSSPAEGKVRLVEGATTWNEQKLSNAAVTFSLSTLDAGTHILAASYGGDGLNPSSISTAASITVQPATVTAKADSVAIPYGASLPVVAGSWTGILPQDSSTTNVIFSTSAGVLSPVGTYPIRAELRGGRSANYNLQLDPDSGSLNIQQAKTSLTLTPVTQNAYAGLPVVLSARLTAPYAGIPSGEVQFLEGNTVVARAMAVGGQANGTYLNAGFGTHVFTAVYSGDANFLGATSSPLSVSVAAVPDYTLTAAASSQTVQAGLIANYALDIASSGGPFTGTVVFSVSGLPSGAQASFSPAALVPGTAGASTTLSIQTPATLAHNAPGFTNHPLPIGLAIFTVGLLGCPRRRRCLSPALLCLVSAVSILCAGCGARTVATGSSAVRSFPLTVTATGTNLTGAVVSHSTAITLIIR